jgi:outer membrane protein OmpA-like peptidoglycan-associated protein
MLKIKKKISMKKQLLLIGLILGMFTAFSQEVKTTVNPATEPAQEQTCTADNDFCPHRINVYLGGGYANNTFKNFEKDLAKKCSYTALAEIGYTYFFHQNFGIGIGVGINKVGAIATINDSRTLKDVHDPIYFGEELYDLSYKATNIKEKINVWAIEVPLTVQAEKKWGKHGIYGGLGVKGYFPIAANVKLSNGIFELDEIYGGDMNQHYQALKQWMDPVKMNDKTNKQKMRCSVDILGEFGGVFGISRATDFYIGAYASYGFLNVYPKDGKMSFENIGKLDPRLSAAAGYYVNSVEKWNLLQVGVKAGFHFKTCKNLRSEKYMRDEKRAFMDEMKRKQNEPIIVTNTVQEYYYFVPTISQELLDEAGNDPQKKKALMDLAQSLSNIKILFDLDKDIPKLDESKRQYIDKASEVLKANPDLKITVTGYTSPEGTVPHNQNLGNRRALAVRDIFINKGVPADQIAVQNFTADDPQHKIDIPEKEYPEQRAVIFKIEKK